MVTRAYLPESISSANCGPSAWGSGAWSAINYAQLHTPPTWLEIHERFDACRSGQPEISYEFASHQIANPQLSFPPDVNQIDPTWSTCSGIYLGVQDPPRILSKVSSLGPVTGSVAQSPQPGAAMAHTTVPQPASSVVDPLPIATGHVGGMALHPSFHQTVHGFLPMSASVGELNPAPTVKPAVFITGPLDTTQPNSAQAAPVPQWSQITLTPENHRAAATITTITPKGAATASAQGGSTSLWSDFAHPVQSNPANGGTNEPASPRIVQPQPVAGGTSTDTSGHPLPNVAGNQLSQPQRVDQPNILPPSSGNDNTGVAQGGQVSAPIIAQGQTQGQSSGAVAPASDPAAIPALPSIAGSKVQLATNGGILVGSVTVPPGHATTLGGQQVSVASAGVVIDSKTYPYAAPAPVMATPPANPLQVGGQQISRVPNGQDVLYGGSTISGHVVSAGPSIAVDQTSYALPVAAPSPVVVGGQSMHRAPNGGIILGSTTIQPGSETTISGQKISAGISSVVVDHSTYVLPTLSPSNVSPAVIVGGQPAQRVANGAVAYGGAQIEPGAKPTIIAGHTVSAGLDNIVVDGNTYALPTPILAASAPLIVDGQSIRNAQGGGVMIGSSTIMPGSKTTFGAHIISVDQGNIGIDGTRYALPSGAGLVLDNNIADSNGGSPVTLLNGAVISAGGRAATISGTVISVLPSHQGLLVGSQTIPIPSAPTVGHVLTAAGETVTAVNGQIIVAGSTLSKGGVTTIHSTKISLGDSGLVIGSSTIPLPTVGPTSTAPAITTLGQTFSQIGVSDVVFGHATLSTGGSGTTILGTEVSLGTSGLVVGSSTVAFLTAAPTLTTLGHTFVPVNGSAVAIDGRTFSVGQGTTIDGSLVSVGSSGLVIGSTTIPISVETGSQSMPLLEIVKATATSSGYGDLIMRGLGGNAPAATPPPSSSATASLVGSGGSRARSEVWILSVVLGSSMCIVALML